MPTVTTPDSFVESILHTTNKATFKIIIFIIPSFHFPLYSHKFPILEVKASIIWFPAHLSYLSCIIPTPLSYTPTTLTFSLSSNTRAASHPKAVTMAVLSRMFFPLIYLVCSFLSFIPQFNVPPQEIFFQAFNLKQPRIIHFFKTLLVFSSKHTSLLETYILYP